MYKKKWFSRLFIGIFFFLIVYLSFLQNIYALAIDGVAYDDSAFNGGNSSVCTSIWIHVIGINTNAAVNGGLTITVDGQGTNSDTLGSLDTCYDLYTNDEIDTYNRLCQYSYCFVTASYTDDSGNITTYPCEQSNTNGMYWTIYGVTDSTILICNPAQGWACGSDADTNPDDLNTSQACFTGNDLWLNVFSGGNPGFYNGPHTITVTQFYATWTSFLTDAGTYPCQGFEGVTVNYYLLSSDAVSSTIDFENTLPGVNACSQSVDSSIEPTFCELGVCIYPFCFAKNKIYTLQNDITMSGTPGLSMTRAYNLRQPFSDYSVANGFYEMGYGWWSEYSQCIEDNYGWVYYFDETGRKIYFQRTTPYFSDYQPNLTEYYCQETEYVLTKTNSMEEEVVGDTLGQQNQGYQYTLIKGNGCCGGGYKTLTFDKLGRITQIADSNNNTINIDYCLNHDQFGCLTEDWTYTPLTTQIYNSNGQVIHLIRYNIGDETTKIQYAVCYNTNDQNLSILTVKYNYDGYDNLTSVINQGGQTASFIYSDAANHQLSQYININGETTNWVFDTNGVCTNTNVNGIFSLFTYNFQPTNNLTIQADTANKQVIYHWLNNGIVTGKDYPDNSSTQQFPDQYNNITTAINENGDTTNMFYDAYNNLTTAIDYAGNTTQYFYDDNFEVCTTLINAAGQQYNFLLDGNGNITTMIFPDSSQWYAYYDSSGNLTTLVNPLGYASYYFYDVYGNPSGFQDPLGNQSFTFYDSFGNLTATINALSQQVEFQYDTLDRVTAVLMPLGRNSYLSYNNTFNPISAIDPMGHQTQFQYDSLDRLTSTLSAASTSISKYYDNYSLLTTGMDENGNPTFYQYDSCSRLIQGIDAAGNYSQVYYDAASQVTSARKPDGTLLPRWYDVLGQVTAYVHGETQGLVTTFQWYDVLGNLTTVYDINQGYTQYYYDLMGRITTKCYSTYTVSYFYDVLGRKTAYLDPQGNLFTYTYDADNHLISLNNWANQTTSYSYDALGEETAEYYPNGTIMNYYYDVLGELTSIQFSYAPVGEQNAQYYANGKRMNYSHNAFGRLTSIQISNNYAYGQTSSILLNAGSQETSTNYGLQLAIGDTVIGQSSSANYTVHWGLGQFNYMNPSTLNYINPSTLQVLAYAYDSVGNRTLQVDISNNSTFYYYDTLYRLTTEQRIGTNAYTRSYTYDPAGNRTQMLILSDSTSTTTYILNNLNQITASTTNGVETLYSYDANGNLLSKGSTSYLWNKDDQLITVFLSNDTVSYLYDSFGRRSQRVHGNSTTNYQLEGLDTQIELDNSTVQRTYTLSGGLTGQIISVRYNGDDYFYHYDSWGNVLFITDSSGAIVSSYIQESFGNVLDNLIGFPIQHNLQSEYQEGPPNYYHLNTGELDPVTGLYHCQSRWYDPTSGTWICNDYYKYSSYKSNSNNNPNSLILKPVPLELDPQLIDLIIAFSMPGGNEGKAGEGLLSKICKIKYIPIWGRTFLGEGTLGVAKEGYGFTSFEALKKYLGDPGPNNVWHHIVEQREPNVLRFKPCNIHNTKNAIAVSKEINQKIADYFSSKQPFTEGMTLREWLNNQPYEEHYKRGIEALKIYGVLK